MPSFHIATLFTAVLHVGMAVAGVFGNFNGTLSPTCKDALDGLVNNSTSAASQCLNLPGIERIFTTPANTSIIQSISDFVHPFCSADPCSDDTIMTASNNISASCSGDFSGALGGAIELGIEVKLNEAIRKFYTPARNVICLEVTQGNENENCFVQFFSSVESAIGEPLSPNNLASLHKNLLEGKIQVNETVVKNITCTDCIHAAWLVVKSTLSGTKARLAEGALKTLCGPDFVNGTSPSDVSEATGTAALALESAESGATSISSFRVPAVGLLVTLMSLMLGVLVA